MKRVTTMAIALVAVAFSNVWAVDKVDAKRETATLQRDVRKIFTALFHGQANVVASYMHPAMITKMGGLEKAKTSFKGAAAQLGRLEVKQESLTFPSAPTFVAGKNGRRFAIVPTESIVTGIGQRAKIVSFELAIKEAGAKDWKYVQGPQLKPETLSSLFPDFPPEQPLPTVSKENL